MVRKENWIGHILRGDGQLNDVTGVRDGREASERETKDQHFGEAERSIIYGDEEESGHRDEWGRWKPRSCL